MIRAGNGKLWHKSPVRLATAPNSGANASVLRVDGRDTIRYLVMSPVNRQYLGWIDPRLGFLIRLEAEAETTVDVVNIHETPQSKELFEIPPASRKFDPQRLIDRIRQSDVWVEPVR
jgi:hypothetical protein